MKELKFRVWDKTDCKMYEVISMGFLEPVGVYVKTGMFEGKPCGKYLHDNYELMQYNGSKDIALKEEYDGDIVRDADGKIWQVSMGDTRGPTYIRLDIGEIVTAWDFLFTHVIIGNIYENPELLKKVG